jgi:hypothetical protein
MVSLELTNSTPDNVDTSSTTEEVQAKTKAETKKVQDDILKTYF